MGEHQQVPTGAGYHYNHPLTGEKMVEYHVNIHDSFQEKLANETWLGGRCEISNRETSYYSRTQRDDNKAVITY